MNIADKLLQLNTNLGTINTEVGNQEEILSDILKALEKKEVYNTLFISTNPPTDDIGREGDIYIEQVIEDEEA